MCLLSSKKLGNKLFKKEDFYTNNFLYPRKGVTKYRLNLKKYENARCGLKALYVPHHILCEIHIDSSAYFDARFPFLYDSYSYLFFAKLFKY